MRYYLDFEFCDHSLTPISLGIVSQTGKRLYLVNVNHKKVIENSPNREWLLENVAPNLYNPELIGMTKTYHIDHWAEEINSLISFDDFDVEFWGYFADYDWIMFCKLFGTMLQLPERFPKYCLDLKQLAISCGVIGSLKKIVPPREHTEHNALCDADWIRLVHMQLIIQYGRNV